MSNDKEKQAGSGGTSRVVQKPLRLLAAFLIVPGLWSAFLLIDHAYGFFYQSVAPPSWGARIALAFLLAVVLVLVWEKRKRLLRWSTSPALGTALLTSLLLLTILGTLLLQGLSRQEHEEWYGASTAKLLAFLRFDDMFHSLPYRGLLGLLAVCSVLVALRRRIWRGRRWGILLCHLGVVTVLLGGLAGILWGQKGFLELHEGESASTVSMQGLSGRGVPEVLPLGFSLRLDDFEIERYPAEYRLHVYRKKGRGYELLSSYRPEEVQEWTRVSESAHEFRVVAIYPDFGLVEELLESTTGEGLPMLELWVPGEPARSGKQQDESDEQEARDIKRGGERFYLLADVPRRDSVVLPNSAARVRFVWDRLIAKPPIVTEATPEAHFVEYRLGPEEDFRRVRVTPGETCALGDGGYELTVLEYYPDYTYIRVEQRAYSASREPNNPALRLSLRAREQEATEYWLFARVPEWGLAHGQGELPFDMVYRYESAREPWPREVVIEGITRRVIEYRSGRQSWSGRLRVGDEEELAPGLEARCVRFLERAMLNMKLRTKSQEWLNPVAQLEVRSGAGRDVEQDLLPAGEAHVLEDWKNEFHLRFGRKREDVKSFCSRVSILQHGEVVLQDEILVNESLSYKGYSFYQADYKEYDLSYSLLKVVKDPGVPIVYLGFAIVVVGIVVQLYLRRWIR